ncbi:histidine kinase [Novosphingobium barchaimii LL02]|uniref:histidine kinase n=1 Tax=Novosphingobium barchaimii LL02 TaxID=1114963 RepID=A0A0J7XJ93_9SPHN|nr:HAMP domain-containing sensor histidine kinase [Novosphingobium barchaimii]KMS51807.1 histidine kinase [Novosphingobium barchaimii LL02]
MISRATPPRTGSLLPGAAPKKREVPLLVAYAFSFAFLHWTASPWGGAGFFSLWYPPAGLRFAMLWNCGPRITPWLIVAELCADIATGVIHLGAPDTLQAMTGIMRPGITYGIAIAAVRHIAREHTDTLALPPMTLGLAAVAAPALNALMVVPFEALLPSDAGRYRIGVDIAISLTGLAVGDLLGILVLAPLLLWLAAVAGAPRRMRIAMPPLRPVLEDATVIGGCLLLTIALWRAGLGAQPAPGLLAGAWIGLRHGRIAAWLAILAQVLVFLPYSAGPLDDAARLELHLGIAAVVLVTWLAGSFSDAQKTSRAAIDKRNRLLFQAERLKTLRAMSVAVIHEISQPLSTLAIEAGHLRSVTQDLDPEIADSAALVDRKARALSDLVRRLRRFGGRDVDEPSPLPVAMLMQTACQIVAAEVRGSSGRLECAAVAPDLVVQAQEIELTQALVNLLRNAFAASPGETVSVRAYAVRGEARIEVANPVTVASASAGMGVGLVIARTIIEAHGGTLVREDETACIRFALTLPLLAGATI